MTEAITIHVDSAIASSFNAVSEAERRKLEVLLGFYLQEVMQDEMVLKEVMQRISQRAQARGLTEATLAALLDEA